ncbi:MAG TPA: stress responsive protein [Ruminococcaceae bacterium]|nr:stress responsive protein [Oscillospiraceae bacterium]
MVKHIILWKLRDDLSESEKSEVRQNAKAGLESLGGKIEGLLRIKVNINPLETSNCDMMLDSEFESFDALKGYAKNPEHNKIADKYVRPFTAARSCIDYKA